MAKGYEMANEDQTEESRVVLCGTALGEDIDFDRPVGRKAGARPEKPPPAERITLDKPLDIGLDKDFVLSSQSERERFAANAAGKARALVMALYMKAYRFVLCREIGRLVALASRANRDDFRVFARLSGHVEKLELRIYYWGWDKDRGPTYELGGYLPTLSRPKAMTISEVRAAIRLVRVLSDVRCHGL